MENRYVAVFFCGDDIVAQGRSCFGMQEFARWHTIVVTALWLGMFAPFFTTVRVHIVALGACIALAMTLPLLALWIMAFSSGNRPYAAEAWHVTPHGGLVANCLVMAGVLGYAISLALAGRRARARR